MAKKQQKRPQRPSQEAAAVKEEKNGLNLKEMLSEAALGKLKQLEKDMKAETERQAQEAAEKKRREQEEREKNKSFGELLDEYEKKGKGKYS
ncbi:YqkE family protein [Brevibacillus choshinensis]|uniref:YqkE family protein n=1 Tax=Brevibacillus choshinensis TaxID=54911 RepID=A0ABX7FQ78_BRECH|nr:YqkE family protein [Brevibacillus choshinensis]QRG68398.1 YqkE family protein [Brevibacillus choshinensis]